MSATLEEIHAKVHAMFTDPGHVRASDPGRVEGNVVFAYLQAFDPDREEVAALEALYRVGGLGDVTIKRRVEELLQALLAPIRERREQFAREPDEVMSIVRRGTERARTVAASVLNEVRGVFLLDNGSA